MTNRRPRTAFAILLLAPLLLAAQCSILGLGDDAGDLEGAWRRWRSAGIDDYTMVLARSCFCEVVGPVAVVVRDGSPVSYTVVATGQPLQPHLRPWHPTVEGLFELLEEAEDRNANRIDVRYDAVRGYPVSIYVDYAANVADEEIGFEVTSLDPAG